VVSAALHFDGAIVWRGAGAEPARVPFLITGGTVTGFDEPSSGAAAERVDVCGLHIVPGFVDAHTHVSVAAWVPWFADGAQWESAARAVAEVRGAASVRTSGWIIAFNIDDDEWTDGAPTAADLEAAAPGRAVLLVHLSLHRALLSETALRRLDISRATHDVKGDIEKGRGGALTGRIWESVFGRAVTTALVETARDIGPGRLDEMLAAEAERHLAAGITACHDPCIPDDLLPAMMRLAERTPLRLSWSHVSAHGILDAPAAEVAARPCGDGPASAKLFLDGAHRCALCLDPRVVVGMAGTAVGRLLGRGDSRPLRELMRYRTVYKHPHFHMPYLRFAEDDLVACLGTYRDHGVRPKIHALGNEAVAQACRALRRLGMRDVALEHLLVLSDRDVDSVAECGAVASLQPGFIPHYGPSLLDRGIAGRLKAIPVASLLRGGAPVALSSDYPCGPLDPLFNIRQAIERRVPDGRVFDGAEAVSVSTAVAAYSAGATRAIHGTPGPGLAAGVPADFVVLSGPPGERDTRVLRTWIGGREAWRAADQSSVGSTT